MMRLHTCTALLLLLAIASLQQSTALPISTPSTSGATNVLRTSSTTTVPLPAFILGDAGLEEAETFTVVLGPLAGRLCFYSSISPCLSSAVTFTRDDISFGNVYYEADGDNLAIDAFLLAPYGGAGEQNGSWFVVRGPNQLTEASVAIVAGVKRGGTTTIDAEGVDVLQDISISNSVHVIEYPKLGRLSLGDRFTVRDLVEGKLAYHQDSSDAGCSDEVVLAIIEGSSYRLLVMQLAIQSAENSDGIVSLAVSSATAKSSSFVLTKAEVNVLNAPYCDSLVRLRITRAPSSGVLLISGSPLLPSDSFTLEDLNNGLVWYNSLSGQADTVDHIGLTLILPITKNVRYNATEAWLDIRTTTCLQCNERYTFNVSSRTVQLSRINMEGTFGASLGGMISVDVKPDVPLQMMFLLFSVDRGSPVSLARNDVPISKHVISLFDLQNTQLILTDSTRDDQFNETIRFRIAVLTPEGDVVYSHRVYSVQVQWAKLHMELEYHTVSPGNSVKASIKVEGFVIEDVNTTVSSWRSLPSGASCQGSLLPGGVCMTQSSVIVSSETKESSYIISAKESDLGRNIVVSIQTAKNAVKGTTGSQATVQVTKGSDIWLGPQYKPAPPNPICDREVEVTEKDSMLRIMLVRPNGLQERAGVTCSTATVVNGATADEDFVARPGNPSSVVYFDAGSTIAYCPIEIIDDSKWEPRERFIVTLSSVGGPAHIISEASTLCVYITSEDVPTVSFQNGSPAVLHLEEPRFTSKTYQVPIYRHIPEGSLDYQTEVNYRVLQWQSDSAEEDSDFQGQPNWNSLIFTPNQAIAYVDVVIMNDAKESEGDESFHIEIQRDDHDYSIAGSDNLKVVIKDAQNVVGYSVVRFLHSEITVVKVQNQISMVAIELQRSGNLDQMSRISCTLVPDTAIAGIDFYQTPRPQQETFPIGSSSLNCSVLLSNKKAGGRKSFTVLLAAEDNHTVILTDSMQVHIEDPPSEVSSTSVSSRHTVRFTDKKQGVLWSEQANSIVTVPVTTSSNFPSDAKITCTVSPSAGIYTYFRLHDGCTLLLTEPCDRCTLTVTLSTNDARIEIGEQSTTKLSFV